MTHATLIQCPSLCDVDWPDSSVFIVDAGLPRQLVNSLPSPRIDVDAGESIKSLAKVGELAHRVLSIRSSRPLTLVAVGGGSVGDAVGFLASILWRGVDLWHVPTTLVAMVDSAHGGKTAVNLEGHKNQLGTFHTADTVVVTESFLETLPLDCREEGLVELIKGLWLEMPDKLATFDDPRCYDALLTDGIDAHRQLWTPLIGAAVEAKRRIVSADPEEKSGLRRILNLGHTAGHGVEALFGLPHGRAVAWGLAACAVLSEERAALSSDDAARLRTHIDPLLTPIPSLESPNDEKAFCERLCRDKKRRGDRLISILLDGPGQPIQTDKITEKQWWNALQQARQDWQGRTLNIEDRASLRPYSIELPPDKSRQNRAAVIAHLRPGPTEIFCDERRVASDAVHLRRALECLSKASPEEVIDINAADGGTTGRFLLAVAAARPGTTHLHFSAALQRRPHDELVDALTDAGAVIEPTDTGFTITGWPSPPSSLSVDPTRSSQFASALALLAAGGYDFELGLDGELASRPYFELTLSMLTEAGVDIDTSQDVIRFSRTPRLDASKTLEVAPDTSSAVVWRAIEVLRDDLRAPQFPDAEHPDQLFDDIAHRLSTGDANDSLTVNLEEAPDLTCVLAALACLVPASLTIVGAAHLRHKESNRIDDLAQAFSEIGVDVEPRADGLHIPDGIQRPVANSLFNPRGDHRLAMAALVFAATGTTLQICEAGCVAKSYPDLWRNARRVGLHIRRNQ